MAVSRPIRATGATRGASTAIPGVRAFTIETTMDYSFGMSDAEIGPTSADLNGFNTRVDLVVDSDANITTFSNHTVEALALLYTVQSGTARKRTVDNVQFGEAIGPITIPQAPGETETVEYRASGNVIAAAADATPADYMAVANQ